jgi:heme exporter protein C
MKFTWWKILGIVLLVWTFTAGLLVPLRPGIMEVMPTQFKAGQTATLNVRGYNTQWLGKTIGVAWLHIDEVFKVEKDGKKRDSTVVYAIQSKSFKPIDDRHAEFVFDIPQFLPLSVDYENASLLVKVEGSDLAIRPMAVSVEQDSMNTTLGKTLWNATMQTDRTWTFSYPYRNILYETIRNTWFHVPMWFAMFALFGLSVWYSILYLTNQKLSHDIAAAAYTQVGIVFGLLGLFTGGLWANYTWGKPFPLDIKIIMTYTCLAIYLAYFILRAGFESQETRARVSAVYSIFAFMTIIPLLYVIPKLAPDSLHPNNGGNPAFGSQDMDNTMRLIFYPAIIGWICVAIWMASLVRRYTVLNEKKLSRSNA